MFTRSIQTTTSLLLIMIILLTACVPSVQQASTPSPAPTTAIALSVSTTLDGLTTLPHRIQWEAVPHGLSNDQIIEVDFLIDGQPAWVENNAPYFYGRDGNYLVTSFLTPGEHSFSVHVVGVGGRNIDSTIKAAVKAPILLPNELANTSWTREMTSEDRQKATSGEKPPAGQWGLDIDSVGWRISYLPDDPNRNGQLFDIAYQSKGMVELRPTIERPSMLAGAICKEPDPEFLWSYTVSEDGQTLSLHPNGKDPCGDRVAILEGTWTRVNN